MSIGINIFPQGSNNGGGSTSSVLINYKGTYDASANNPTLTNGVGTLGDWYSVSVAGTNNPTGANIPVGDAIYYNGSIWKDYGPNPNNTNNYVIPNGFTPITGQDVSSGDNVTTAFEKVQGQLNASVVNWDAGITFDMEDATWYNGYLWYSLIANNKNNQPSITSPDWARQADTNIRPDRTINNTSTIAEHTITYADNVVRIDGSNIIGNISITLNPITALQSQTNTSKGYRIIRIDSNNTIATISCSGSDTFQDNSVDFTLQGSGSYKDIDVLSGLTYMILT
jgi:hypothetical protein